MSLLTFLGEGTVTATKETNTDEIMVYVPSLFPQAEGRMVANAERVERTSVNAAGETVRSTSLKSNSIPAKWRKMDDSNRITAPDVREGSTVGIYQVPGQNVYYWSLQGVNPDTFRMETVMYGWNANPNLTENSEFNVDNFYGLVVDTRNGLMQLRTSEANKEATVADIQLNTTDGTLTLGFKNGMMINVNDVEQSFTITNQQGAVLRMIQKEATLYLPDKLSIFAENTFNLKTKEINIQAETANIDIGLTKWKGRIEHTGDSTQLGNHEQEGNTTQTGMYTHIGDMDRTGNSVSTGTVIGLTDVRTMLVSLNLHIHPGVQGGNGTTAPPLPS